MVDCHVCVIIVHRVSSPTISTTLLTLKANNVDCVCHHSRRLYSCHLYMSRCRHRRCRHCRCCHQLSLSSSLSSSLLQSQFVRMRSNDSCSSHHVTLPKLSVSSSTVSVSGRWRSPLLSQPLDDDGTMMDTTTFNYYDCPQICQLHHGSIHTLRCRKFFFDQVIGRSGSNQIIGGRRVIGWMMMMCDVRLSTRDQDIYEYRHRGENLPTRLQVQFCK